MAAAAARSVLRSAIASARSATASLSASVNQKQFSTRIFRSPVEMSGVSGGKVACFSTGSKRFQRVQKKKIDLKRNTPSMGIVEGVEYDANRTTRIAIVRWEGGANRRKSAAVEESSPPEMSLESTAGAAVRGSFAFSSLPGEVKQSKKSARDVLFSAFSSSKAKGENSTFSCPRIAVAGAKPTFFVFERKEGEIGGKNTNTKIQRWNQDSVVWKHRMKRNAALSWSSFRQQESLGLKKKESKKTMDQANRAPVSYILASHQLQPGMMVMNWSKPPPANKY